MTVTTKPAHSPRPLTATELSELWQQLQQPAALLELGALLACLAGAWLLVRLWRGKHENPKSIWFGHHLIDGILFPALALLLALVARRVLTEVMPLAVFKVAVPILVSLVVIRLTVKVLRAAFPASTAVVAAERTVSWLAWIGTILWVTGLLPIILDELDGVRWTLGASTISLRTLIEGSLSVVLVLILTLSVSSAIEARLLKGAGAENLSIRKIVSNVMRTLLITLGLMMALSTVGVDLTAFSVLGGAIGVGLGFGLQKLASNYVSGFVILAERSLHIGDLVKVDNFEGRIIDITTRYTVLRAANGREAIVPNEMLIIQRVENASGADVKQAVTSVVRVAYDADLDQLRARILAAISPIPRVMASPAPTVHLTNLVDGLELTITFWVGDPENGVDTVRSAANTAIWGCLKDHLPGGAGIPVA